MKTALRLFLPTAVALVALGAPSRAGDVVVSYSQRFGNGSISLGFGHAKGHGKLKHLGFSYVAGAPCAPAPTWVPGQWVTVEQQVWVPGTWEQVWIEPVYRTCYDPCGRVYRVLVSAGHWQSIERPGHYATKWVQVFQPGHWSTAAAAALPATQAVSFGYGG
jgi:hypothetical protein